ncbi:MAG: hypothetical protein U0640_00825 [Phycisphaerales bacterium]
MTPISDPSLFPMHNQPGHPPRHCCATRAEEDTPRKPANAALTGVNLADFLGCFIVRTGIVRTRAASICLRAVLH